MRYQTRTLKLALLTWFMASAATCPIAAEREADARVDERTALRQFDGLIGEWRGVGQPRRGSNKGAWRENAKWVWDFSDDGVALEGSVTTGKLMQHARLRFQKDRQRYVLTLVDPDGGQREYQGQRENKKFVLLSTEGDESHRVTITLRNWQRALMLFEVKPKRQSRFVRVAEVGYTRAGTRLARNGAGGPLCIVTGGTGTSTVEHEGKKYWVCCSGCRDAFNDDPEGIIAEARERAARETAGPKTR